MTPTLHLSTGFTFLNEKSIQLPYSFLDLSPVVTALIRIV